MVAVRLYGSNERRIYRTTAVIRNDASGGSPGMGKATENYAAVNDTRRVDVRGVEVDDITFAVLPDPVLRTRTTPIGIADQHVPEAIDCDGPCRIVAPCAPDVPHDTILPNEWLRKSTISPRSDDLLSVINGSCFAKITAERAKIGYRVPNLRSQTVRREKAWNY
jgi:hypothetical protein